MKITDFIVMDENGDSIQADAHGNNLSVLCELCQHPILMTALENQRGYDEKHAASCKGCGQKYYLDLREQSKKLYVNKLA
jgi:hypothetical protein